MAKEAKKTELNEKQKLFCQEYLKDLNATQAAIRAGYSEKTAKSQGQRLLTNVYIKEFLEKQNEQRQERVKVDADYVLKTITETIERCAQKEQVMEYCPAEKAMVPTGEWKFEHRGVLKGCELLGKHLKLFTDKVEHSIDKTLEDIITESFKKEKEND